MGNRRHLAAAAVVATLGGVSTWVVAAEDRGVPPPGDYTARPASSWTLTGTDGEVQRLDLLRRAEVRLPDRQIRRTPALETLLTCRFVNDEPSGTSAKFNCVLDGGEVVKVKYGRNPEIHAEVAATRLLTQFGFAADDVAIARRVRCYGCPRFPFLTMQLLALTSAGTLLDPHGHENGYTDFEWVAVERRFPGPAIETETTKGWGWFELEGSGALGADVDALRLLAIFLAHWDNKAENQRLVCLDAPPASESAECARPLAMIQDVGATFGPTKANLARWRAFPVWSDSDTCTVSMRGLPWEGATFPDVRISEAGRAQLAQQLADMDDEEIRALFADARFPEFQAATRDDRDLDAWTEAFHHRRAQIVNARCPTV